MPKISRRILVTGAVSAGISAIIADGKSTMAVAAEAVSDVDVTVSDLSGAVKTAGLNYSNVEQQQMLALVTVATKQISANRQIVLDVDLSPAFLFDPLVAGANLPAGKSSCTISAQVSGAAINRKYHAGNIEELAFKSVVALSRLIKERMVSCEDLTRMYLARLKRYGPRLLCVVNLMEESALSHAKELDREIANGNYRGPLHGIPWGAKDLLATRGTPTTWGAKPYEHQIFDYDATVVERLTRAGAILVAKLSMGELAMGDVWFAGKTRNPWNPEHGSSGSSAGPGSATAAGLVGFAIGTETLGSIVSPCVVNGVTGLRPTYGRVSRYGAMALSWTMDKIGPMCRSVEDCALVLAAIQGADGKDRTVVDVPFRWSPRSSISGLRFGYDEEAIDSGGGNPSLIPIYKEALSQLKKTGVSLQPVKLPDRRDEYESIAEITINVEGAAAFSELNRSGGLALLAQQGNNSWPNIFRAGSITPAADYLNASRLRYRLQLDMDRALKGIDGYVTVPFAGPTLVYTNLTGHPTLITRCGLHNGLPIALEIVGALHNESAILRLGHAFEAATQWHTQWPDVSRIV